MHRMNRRQFLSSATMAATAAMAARADNARLPVRATTPRRGPNEEIRVACVGINGQGKWHVVVNAKSKNVRVVTLCDVDENQFAEKVKIVEEAGQPAPRTEFDIRRMLDDKNVDAIFVATPNHWHALATIWACQAGKDVYVEKPCSHNIVEGRRIIEAARKYNRIVQHGTQARSAASVREAIRLLHDGVIGDVYMARALCYKGRDSIGTQPDQDKPPAGVHYDIWLGPAPVRAFNPNRFHYNWHWNWDYGNGDIGNQGVHQMDIARWGLNRTLPVRVSSMGGRVHIQRSGRDAEYPCNDNAVRGWHDAGVRGAAAGRRTTNGAATSATCSTARKATWPSAARKGLLRRSSTASPARKAKAAAIIGRISTKSSAAAGWRICMPRSRTGTTPRPCAILRTSHTVSAGSLSSTRRPSASRTTKRPIACSSASTANHSLYRTKSKVGGSRQAARARAARSR